MTNGQRSLATLGLIVLYIILAVQELVPAAAAAFIAINAIWLFPARQKRAKQTTPPLR